MSDMTVTVEQLENGLHAAFVHFPHFRTHAARLTIGSGSMHESDGNFGAAHFLEHVTFQGTESFPSRDDVTAFSEGHSLSRNAFTSRTETIFTSDGYELGPNIKFIGELAFRPLLTDDALEGERKPIDDELRRSEGSPYYYSGLRQIKAEWGKEAGRSILGSHDDIKKLTGDNLRAFHASNYRLANAALLVCSADPIEKQRETANELLADISDEGVDSPGTLEVPKFNPYDLTSSLQQVGEPHAQTLLSIAYEVPAALDRYENLAQGMVASVLSQMLFKKLRLEMALCYGAEIGFQVHGGKHFGQTNLWSEMEANVSLNGIDAVVALDAMREVLRAPLSEVFVRTTSMHMRQVMDRILESPPGAVADYTLRKLSQQDRMQFSFDETLAFANMVTPQRLEKIRNEIIANKPLVLATGPDQVVLDSIGEWAETNAAS